MEKKINFKVEYNIKKVAKIRKIDKKSNFIHKIASKLR